ncbi:hypothetical protein [Methylomonas sp. ZR1]|uniref:hypothetical protein n=1 Tax=Methylomonas sp. ZR1 TaxID=1797072 RepID=UPI001492EA01|nr:hypothetical protein [Methylomonas sp. ZR1]
MPRFILIPRFPEPLIPIAQIIFGAEIVLLYLWLSVRKFLTIRPNGAYSQNQAGHFRQGHFSGEADENRYKNQNNRDRQNPPIECPSNGQKDR